MLRAAARSRPDAERRLRLARRIPGSKKGGGSSSLPAEGFRPSREDILTFITENPDQSGKREIAKAFSLKGEARIWLKDLLRELQDEGLLQKQRKRLIRPGALPHVTVLDIFGRDSDGSLIARPAEATEFDRDLTVLIRTQRAGPSAGIGDRVLAKTFPSDVASGPPYTARIIKVFEHRRETVLGVFRTASDGTLRIVPVERRQPELVVEPEFRGDAKDGDLVEVDQARETRYGLPRGRVRAVLGSLTSEKAVSMIAIHAHEIPHIFPPEVLSEAEKIQAVGLEGREDWRSVPLITIDPADAKDHDDAVFAEPDTDETNIGGYIVTVAIADVAAYVRPGSALDREALKRGNSVYFPDRVVPMLPERLSNDLCSLKEGQDRPAMAVRMAFSADGRKLRHSFHRITMRSAAKLAYPQAQAAVDGAPDDKTRGILDTVLNPLWAAYAILKRGRDAREPLELDLPERKILLKADGTVDRVVTPERLDAHKLIEEFMIQANVCAAESLERKSQSLIYRIHDGPSLAKQESLREFLHTIGMSLARGAELRPTQINKILAGVHGQDNETLVNEVVLRSQSQAEYSPDNIGHFGLNLRRYAHFTSPIRRYADLIVHRALIGALRLGSGGITPDEEAQLEEISALISATERRAMAAERDTVDRLIAIYLSERIGESFEGRISGVTKAGLFVQLPEFGADGFVPISTLGDDYYHFDEGARALYGERSGKGFRLADTVQVRLVENAPLAGSMRFEMLSEPAPLPGGRKSFHKSRRSKQARQRASQPRGPRRRR
ncbi:MAG: ribonuclease R [Rhizobiaceae bacterium]|nr:ribonuclease R [Rhizobiaceae bacterium]